jgi:hypothetical protein
MVSASNNHNASLPTTTLSTSASSTQMLPMDSGWQGQNEASANQVTIEVLEIVPSSPNGSFLNSEPQPSSFIEIKRR